MRWSTESATVLPNSQPDGGPLIDQREERTNDRAETLAALFRRHRPDDSVSKAISKLIRADLIIVDLCRYRDYADIVAAAGLSAVRSLGFSPVAPVSLSA